MSYLLNKVCNAYQTHHREISLQNYCTNLSYVKTTMSINFSGYRSDPGPRVLYGTLLVPGVSR